MTMIPVEGAPHTSAEKTIAAAYDIDGPLILTTAAEMSHAIAAIGLAIRTHPELTEHLRYMYFREGESLSQHVYSVKHASHGNPELEYDAMTYDGFWRETFATAHPYIVKVFSHLQHNPPGAIELLEDLCETDIKTAAWTSRSLNILDPALCPLVIRPEGQGPRERGLFDVLVSADHVGVDENNRQRLKPHPRGGEIILETLGISRPESVLYFGDRPSDMIAARRLGMIACGVADLRHGIEAPLARTLIDAGACYLVDNVADARDWFGLPPLSGEVAKERARELLESRQYFIPTSEEAMRIGDILEQAALPYPEHENWQDM